MSTELDGFERNPPSYSDADNPALARAATVCLRSALVQASESAVEIGELWEVFREFITRYQYGAFVESIVESTRDDVRAAIARSEHEELRKEAVDALRRELRKELEDELSEDLRQQLLTDLRPIVEKTLRGKLLADPGFIADTRAELQRKILGL